MVKVSVDLKKCNDWKIKNRKRIKVLVGENIT